jgi:hypothetical protein
MKHLIYTNEVPELKNGEMLIDQDRHGVIEWDPKNASFYKCTKDMTWNALVEELEGQMTLNATVYDYLLKNPDLIPEKWKKEGKFIYFAGTVLYCDHGRGMYAQDVRGIWFFQGKPVVSTRNAIKSCFTKGSLIALYKPQG